jgi:MoaA/NifB/PqqE/SkfB family radical SAM enzyme
MRNKVCKAARMAAKILARTMIQANVMVNYDCNCRCNICDYWREPYRSRPPMTLATARAMAEKLRPIAPLAMCLVGGEPLLHPDLIDLAAPLAKAHYLDLVTNGWYMTKELAKELYRTGFSEIGVSIDYASADLHDAQRGVKGLFDKAMAALEILRANRVRPDQRVRMISVVMDDNLESIEPLSEICRRLGVKHNLTLCVCGRGGGKPPGDLRQTVATLKEIQRRRPELLILPGYLEGIAGQGRGPCRSGLNLMAIDSQGQVLRCLDRHETPVGGLAEGKLQDLLNGLRLLAGRERCDDCWTSCRGIVEPLLYGPNRLGNWRYYLKSIKQEPLAGNREADPWVS